MKIRLLKSASSALILLAAHFSAFGESALVGWETTTNSGSYVSQVHLLGPTRRNQDPEKNAAFKGEFASRAGEWRSTLIAIHQLSLDKKGNLQSRKVAFTSTPAPNPEVVKYGNKILRTQVETERLSFEPEDSFVLVFKTKVDEGGKEWLEMVTVRIKHVFVPS